VSGFYRSPLRGDGEPPSGDFGARRRRSGRSATVVGAGVVLVTTTTPPDMPGSVEVVQVESAEEMAHQVWARASTLDVAVLAAAVADFRPAGAAGTKLARSDGPPRIVLEPTPNVLAGLVERVEPGTTVVGFAAETGSVDRAVRKATTYGVDFVVANDVTSPGSGFGTDTNQVTIISAEGERTPLEMMTKRDVAGAIWSRVTELRGSEA